MYIVYTVAYYVFTYTINTGLADAFSRFPMLIINIINKLKNCDLFCMHL